MSMENFAPLMFAGLIVIMLIGFPVAFSLSALGLLCGFVAIEMGWFSPAFMANLPLNVFGILSNDLLLAIPFFTLMGAILEKCGLAEDMLDSMGQLFGPVRGGLGYSVIIVGFILGAVTGTVAGQVIAMAMISLPVMMRYGYDMKVATGVIAASGTITHWSLWDTVGPTGGNCLLTGALSVSKTVAASNNFSLSSLSVAAD